MQKKLIYDINQYISYLNKNGLSVTVHGKGISGLLEHNTHRSPFCMLVKTDSNAWKKCILCQQRVLKKYKDGHLFGMCYAGVEEYVFFVNDTAFISVSGYGINIDEAEKRINRLSCNYDLDKDELLRVYNKDLKHEAEDIQELMTVINPLCHTLSLLLLNISNLTEGNANNTLFESLLKYVQYNFTSDITIKDIAQACFCSESTVCHLFKQYAGIPIKKYITELRIEQAKKTLKTSNLSISTVAQMCGFSNINYFPTVFKKYVGVSPTEYRIIEISDN